MHRLIGIRSQTRLLVALCLATLIPGSAPTVEASGEAGRLPCPGVKRALVLGGGGVRGAYQIGAVWYLVTVLGCDFEHFVGTSTGAITAAVLSQASDRADLERRVTILVEQYRRLKTQDQFARRPFLASLRVFLPRWLGGIDGVYRLEPLEAMLRRQIDVDHERPDRLTVTVVSLQSGILQFSRPESLVDYVIGSASIPFAIEPRPARLWVRGTAVQAGEDTVVVSTLFAPGLADKRCHILLFGRAMAACRQVSATIASPVSSGPEPRRWHTTLRVRDVPGAAWREFAAAVDAAKGTSEEPMLSRRGEPGVEVEFTTMHQLVDGGVAESVPLLAALEASQRRGIDTIVVLTAGQTVGSDETNTEVRGGLSVTKRAFEVLRDSYQETILDNIGLLWKDSDGTGEALDPGAGRHLILIEPWQRFFRDTLDVRPDAIERALWHGCVVAAGLTRALDQDRRLVRVLPFYDEAGGAAACNALRAESPDMVRSPSR